MPGGPDAPGCGAAGSLCCSNVRLRGLEEMAWYFHDFQLRTCASSRAMRAARICIRNTKACKGPGVSREVKAKIDKYGSKTPTTNKNKAAAKIRAHVRSNPSGQAGETFTCHGLPHTHVIVATDGVTAANHGHQPRRLIAELQPLQLKHAVQRAVRAACQEGQASTNDGNAGKPLVTGSCIA
eukprot:1137816-Pelagomonas_calceolata.AAC.2